VWIYQVGRRWLSESSWWSPGQPILRPRLAHKTYSRMVSAGIARAMIGGQSGRQLIGCQLVTHGTHQADLNYDQRKTQSDWSEGSPGSRSFRASEAGTPLVEFRHNIEIMHGYVPGEQPVPGSGVVKLNTNENPYPPSPEVTKALASLDGESLRNYPDPTALASREAAASVYGVPADWIMTVNGSDELLALLARALLEPGRKVAYPVPTYSLYATLAEMQDASIVEVLYDERFNLPLEELLAAQADLTFVCSPNNPSGTVAPLSDLKVLAAGLRGVLAVDEAYADFADENALALVKEHANVIILRTLSKSYSLAGLRLGFGIAAPELLAGLSKIKDSYNIDSVAIRLAVVALNDQTWMRANVERIKTCRTEIMRSLEGMGFRVWPSQANFVLARPPGGDARRLYLKLRDQRIFVRHLDLPGLDDKLRISVGTEKQQQALIEALEGLVP